MAGSRHVSHLYSVPEENQFMAGSRHVFHKNQQKTNSWLVIGMCFTCTSRKPTHGMCQAFVSPVPAENQLMASSGSRNQLITGSRHVFCKMALQAHTLY